MFQVWRRKLHAVEAAARLGRLEEAGEMLRHDDLQDFLPGKHLAGQIAAQFISRARRHAELGESFAAWDDLAQAEALGGDTSGGQAVRQRLIEAALAGIEQLLAAGESREALARIDRWASRSRPTAELRVLRTIARDMQAAHCAENRGDFVQADAAWANAQSLRPDWAWFDERRRQCTLKKEEARRLTAAMHRGLAREDWTAVLDASTALVELAPDHAAAQAARGRAWQAVGIRQTAVDRACNPAAAVQRPTRARKEPQVETHAQRILAPRYMLWIDAVGGFLVCVGSEIVLGPPTAEARADVPILADISRRHAVIRRDGEGYAIEPVRPTRLDGRLLSGCATLADGNQIELGGGVALQFRRPHALSSTARLDIVSRHRTEPAVDAILLMAESCVLGPAAHSHVVCPHWNRDVVLFRRGEHFACRTAGDYAVGGQACSGQSELSPPARVEADDFSFSIELLA